eukprot:CAMPEP_0202916092 /NCGR_PEP_ID=MMETSP1392-20130828/67613_1 /ASSEMBLY_ACC=CAM_ASM_000868 /TAXON_ID=225041 /ORGANISM="Chlamydomonas chlamydogama, Strain SAG 11-48b" /LENGTH=380 /DNA_ID=CAMNT_0049608379 /DNA_START=152 /DNA_END=1291 /DNA_ORIENTATION=-
MSATYKKLHLQRPLQAEDLALLFPNVTAQDDLDYDDFITFTPDIAIIFPPGYLCSQRSLEHALSALSVTLENAETSCETTCTNLSIIHADLDPAIPLMLDMSCLSTVTPFLTGLRLPLLAPRALANSALPQAAAMPRLRNLSICCSGVATATTMDSTSYSSPLADVCNGLLQLLPQLSDLQLWGVADLACSEIKTLVAAAKPYEHLHLAIRSAPAGDRGMPPPPPPASSAASALTGIDVRGEAVIASATNGGGGGVPDAGSLSSLGAAGASGDGGSAPPSPLHARHSPQMSRTSNLGSAGGSVPSPPTSPVYRGGLAAGSGSGSGSGVVAAGSGLPSPSGSSRLPRAGSGATAAAPRASLRPVSVGVAVRLTGAAAGSSS